MNHEGVDRMSVARPWLLALAICVCCCNCAAAQKGDPIREDQVASILGGPVKEQSASELVKGSVVKGSVAEREEQLESYLNKHGMQIFRVKNMTDYAFVNGEHCNLTGGGFISGYELRDFDSNGLMDLKVQYVYGSAIIRPETTIVMDDGKALRIFRVNGSVLMKDGKWWAPHPFDTYHPITGQPRRVAELRFEKGGISVVSKPEEAKWEVVTEIEWVPDKADAGPDSALPSWKGIFRVSRLPPNPVRYTYYGPPGERIRFRFLEINKGEATELACWEIPQSEKWSHGLVTVSTDREGYLPPGLSRAPFAWLTISVESKALPTYPPTPLQDETSAVRPTIAERSHVKLHKRHGQETAVRFTTYSNGLRAIPVRDMDATSRGELAAEGDLLIATWRRTSRSGQPMLKRATSVEQLVESTKTHREGYWTLVGQWGPRKGEQGADEETEINLEQMGDEELIQLLADSKWGDNAYSEINRRLKEDKYSQDSELAKLLFRYWRGSDNERTRRWCFQGLRLVKSQEVVDVLVSQLLEANTRYERQMAAQRLGSIASPTAVSALESAVRADKGVLGPGRSIAGESIFALADIGGPAVPTLIRIWNDSTLRGGCEEQLVAAMGLTKDMRFIPVLIEVLEGKGEAYIRDKAAVALGNITGKDLGPDPVLSG